jgi:cold shock CspA family protein
MDPVISRGNVVRFYEDRGFGFARPSDGGEDIFLHVSELPGQRAPKHNAPIKFEIALDSQGRRRAVNVAYVDFSTHDPAPARYGDDWR